MAKPNTENTIELDDVEHQLVSSLVLQFTRSVDQEEKSFQPDCIAYPVMFEIAKGVLSKLSIDYTPAKKKG